MLFRLGGEKEFRALRVRFTLGIAFIRFRFKLIVFSLFRLLLFRLFRVVNVQILNLSVLQSEPQNVQREHQNPNRICWFQFTANSLRDRCNSYLT